MGGFICEYTDKDGKKVRAIAFYSEQLQFMDKKKVALHPINQDFTFKTDNNGNRLGVAVDKIKVRIVGFVDGINRR